MNWKLIFTLSIAGVLMGVAALFGLTRGIEPLLWLIIFFFYAVVIARQMPSKHFLHGFFVSVVNGVWISIIHSAFFPTYIRNNPEMMANYEKLPHVVSPPVMVLIIGPLIAIVFGLVSGLFAFIAGKFIKTTPPV